MTTGTNHNLDYIILKDRGETCLSAKVMLGYAEFTGLALVLRIRVSRLPHVPNKGESYDWEEIWPEFEWMRLNNKRAANEIVVPTGLGFRKLVEFNAELDATTKVASAFIAERAGDFDQADLLAYTHECLDALINKAIEKAGQTKPEAPIYDGSKALYVTVFSSHLPDDPLKFAPKPHLKLVGGTDYENDSGEPPMVQSGDGPDAFIGDDAEDEGDDY